MHHLDDRWPIYYFTVWFLFLLFAQRDVHKCFFKTSHKYIDFNVSKNSVNLEDLPRSPGIVFDPPFTC